MRPPSYLSTSHPWVCPSCSELVNSFVRKQAPAFERRVFSTTTITRLCFLCEPTAVASVPMQRHDAS